MPRTSTLTDMWRVLATVGTVLLGVEASRTLMTATTAQFTSPAAFIDVRESIAHCSAGAHQRRPRLLGAGEWVGAMVQERLNQR